MVFSKWFSVIPWLFLVFTNQSEKHLLSTWYSLHGFKSCKAAEKTTNWQLKNVKLTWQSECALFCVDWILCGLSFLSCVGIFIPPSLRSFSFCTDQKLSFPLGNWRRTLKASLLSNVPIMQDVVFTWSFFFFLVETFEYLISTQKVTWLQEFSHMDG